ncbi:MAG: hypothetical protein CMN34_06290 [Saprospirales bacterium]|nr:hypothetical protein [Saprospirales bacterium]
MFLEKKKMSKPARCFTYFGLLLSLTLFTGCEKDIILGPDSPFYPDNTLTLVSEDGQVILKSVNFAPDSAFNGKNIGVSSIGSLYDQRFGGQRNSIYSQLLPETYNVDPGTNAFADSCILFIKLSELYGPWTAPQDFYVYEISQEILSTESYSTSSSLTTKPSPIGQALQYIPSLTDSFLIDGAYKQGFLRIELNANFADNLVANMGTDAFSGTSNFWSFFNGLHILTDSTMPYGDGLAVVDLLNSGSQMSLYYSNEDTAGLSLDFVFDGGGLNTRVNRYVNVASGSDVEMALNDNNSPDSVLYLAPFSTAQSIIGIQGLDILADRIINKAEVEFNQFDQDAQDALDYGAPENLFLYFTKDSSDLFFLPDYSSTNSTSFGGRKTEVSENGITFNRYTFNITNYLRNQIQDSTYSVGLVLTTLSNHLPGQIAIGGGNNTSQPIKIRVIYTETE